jgi:hypothetical protein
MAVRSESAPDDKAGAMPAPIVGVWRASVSAAGAGLAADPKRSEALAATVRAAS